MMQLLLGPSAALMMAHNPEWFTECGFLQWLAYQAGTGLVAKGVRSEGKEGGNMGWQDSRECYCQNIHHCCC
jgi:hypothetical protein